MKTASEGIFPAPFVRPRRRILRVCLKGGLGNQMFQYAFALATSRQLHMELEVSHVGWGRPFALGLFDIPVNSETAPPDQIIRCDENYTPGLRDHTITKIQNCPHREVWIEGYFQNEAFFAHEADAVRKVFRLQTRSLGISEGETAVSVSVRSGDDFAKNPKHCVCPPCYYAEAMDLIRQSTPRPVFFVFSDVPARSRLFVKEAPDVVFMPFIEAEAFMRMVACGASVIANSTFSWWAAWLSQADRVISPARFINSEPWEIIPARWTKISC